VIALHGLDLTGPDLFDELGLFFGSSQDGVLVLRLERKESRQDGGTDVSGTS